VSGTLSRKAGCVTRTIVRTKTGATCTRSHAGLPQGLASGWVSLSGKLWCASSPMAEVSSRKPRRRGELRRVRREVCPLVHPPVGESDPRSRDCAASRLGDGGGVSAGDHRLQPRRALTASAPATRALRIGRAALAPVHRRGHLLLGAMPRRPQTCRPGPRCAQLVTAAPRKTHRSAQWPCNRIPPSVRPHIPSINRAPLSRFGAARRTVRWENHRPRRHRPTVLSDPGAPARRFPGDSRQLAIASQAPSARRRTRRAFQPPPATIYHDYGRNPGFRSMSARAHSSCWCCHVEATGRSHPINQPAGDLMVPMLSCASRSCRLRMSPPRSLPAGKTRPRSMPASGSKRSPAARRTSGGGAFLATEKRQAGSSSACSVSHNAAQRHSRAGAPPGVRRPFATRHLREIQRAVLADAGRSLSESTSHYCGSRNFVCYDKNRPPAKAILAVELSPDANRKPNFTQIWMIAALPSGETAWPFPPSIPSAHHRPPNALHKLD